jgi:hypothetical protein
VSREDRVGRSEEEEEVGWGPPHPTRLPTSATLERSLRDAERMERVGSWESRKGSRAACVVFDARGDNPALSRRLMVSVKPLFFIIRLAVGAAKAVHVSNT